MLLWTAFVADHRSLQLFAGQGESSDPDLESCDGHHKDNCVWLAHKLVWGQVQGMKKMVSD